MRNPCPHLSVHISLRLALEGGEITQRMERAGHPHRGATSKCAVAWVGQTQPGQVWGSPERKAWE